MSGYNEHAEEAPIVVTDAEKESLRGMTWVEHPDSKDKLVVLTQDWATTFRVNRQLNQLGAVASPHRLKDVLPDYMPNGRALNATLQCVTVDKAAVKSALGQIDISSLTNPAAAQSTSVPARS